MRRHVGLATIAALLLAACTSNPPTIGPAVPGDVSLRPASPVPATFAPAASAAFTPPPGWTRRLVPTFDGISSIGRIAASTTGFVALSDFGAWHSPDGTTWSSVKTQVDNPRAILADDQGRWVVAGWTSITSAAAGGDAGSDAGGVGVRLAASCAAGFAAAAFATSTDGVTWTAAPSQPSFRTYPVWQLAEAPDGHGYWASGTTSCSEGLPPRSQTWFSADGSTWTPTPAKPTPGLLYGIVAAGGRLVAVGGTSDDPGGPPITGLAWQWDPATSTWSTPATVRTDGALFQAFEFEGGVYALARTDQPTVWSSTDLVTWTATPFPGAGPRTMSVVHGSGPEWLAASGTDGIYGRRSDGTWVRLAGGTDTIEALTASPSGVLAIGLTADGRGVVWQGPATAP